jgi:hypothetical protein
MALWKKSLKIIDIFADGINLSLAGETSFQTIFGGLLTLITILIVAVFSWLIGKDIYYKEKPFFYQQSLTLTENPEIILNYTSFPLAIQMTDINSNVVSIDKYLKLSLQFLNLELNNGVFEIKENRELKLKSCEKNQLPTIDQKTFDNLFFSNFFCPIDWDLKLHGYWSESSLSYLSIQVFMCDYELTPEYCKNKEEIEEFIGKNKINLSLYMLDYQVSVTNYEFPNPSFIINPYKFLTNQLKIVNNNIQTDIISTDSGFLFESVSNVNYMRSVETQSDTAIVDMTDKQLIQYNFYSSNKKIISYRKYIKLSEIIASVGGLLKIFISIFYFINTRFSKISKYLKISEQLFIFDDFQNTDNKNKTNILQSSFTINNFLAENRVIKLNEIPKNYVEILKEKINSHKKNIYKIHLSACNRFSLICRAKRTYPYTNSNLNIQNYELSESKIKKELDLMAIYKSLCEL